MAKAEEIFDQLWTLPVAYYHYTFNACTSAASDPIRGFESIISVYDYLMSLGDPRVAHWPLMKSPWPTVCIALTYLLLVRWGPVFMANRKPLEIRPLILVYNAAVALLNLYIGIELTSKSFGVLFLIEKDNAKSSFKLQLPRPSSILVGHVNL